MRKLQGVTTQVQKQARRAHHARVVLLALVVAALQVSARIGRAAVVADIQASSLMGRVHTQEATDLEEEPEGDHHARHPSCMAGSSA